MYRRHTFIPVLLTMLPIVGLGRVAGAQEPPREQVPMTMSLTIPWPQPRHAIPLSPPITVGLNTARGEHELLGSYTLQEHALVRFDTDGGQPVSITDGFAALTGENGDAIFIAWSARYLQPTEPYEVVIEGIYTVTGGRGRYLGATGSGVIRRLFDVDTELFIGTLEGTVSRLKL